MARLLIRNEWYEQVSPGSLYESEYERIILQQGRVLFPDYHAISFKKSVYSDAGVAKPDLILIDKEYRDW